MVDDADIRSFVRRIARIDRRSGSATVERATLVAEGSDVEQIEAWIAQAGGTPEQAAGSTHKGLYAERSAARDVARGSPPVRYVLPPGALDG